MSKKSPRPCDVANVFLSVAVVVVVPESSWLSLLCGARGQIRLRPIVTPSTLLHAARCPGRFPDGFDWHQDADDTTSSVEVAALEHMDAATIGTLIEQDGFAVVRRVLPRDVVDACTERFWPVLRSRYESILKAPNRGKMRHYLRFQPRGPLLARDGIFGNARIGSVLAEVLGEGYVVYQLAVDVNLPGSENQPIHADITRPEDRAPSARVERQRSPRVKPALISVNFPLVDVNDTNGPLEIVPSSHLVSAGAAKKRLLNRSLRLLRLHVERGDVIFRDLRTLHRGSPNLATSARPMAVCGFAQEAAVYGHLRHGLRRSTEEEALCNVAFMSHISLAPEELGTLTALQREVLRLVPIAKR
mmetsp:Transcript_30444/g.70791  ORF Transcript_30444/g.70791 Transcript_30444/m.70791 type:complete len:360 (-) Transcript_30444:109-1188(-)|eukprot:CAMPEP_0171067284 /NCGR_PEP_ID=MMETSP0766_2-20121228/7911_1 /TAXON_ID=439317 /ORGANISM="Gambierdiscus australes, Strain CAWD 149" /LENGTH=359 /DNA_ID=CAMNT_0011523513 /DNA_START=116 /DNA_END=1195 /DNA_ORIENTATION=-